MGPLSAAIMGGSALLGGYMQNRAAKAASARQMAFQKDMSDTSYQRAVEDMRAAGINPLLAFSQGGASTPVGSTYSPVNIGAAGAQGYAQGATSSLTLAKSGIEQRTLEMLQKEKITLPEIQYTAKNIFTSKMLRSFEAAMNGQVQGLADPYKAIAIFMRGKLRDAGLVSGSGKVTAYNINPTRIGNVFKDVAAFAGNIGIDITTEAGKSILEMIRGTE